MPNLYSVIFTLLVASSSALVVPQAMPATQVVEPQGQVLGITTDIAPAEASTSSQLSGPETPAFQGVLAPLASPEPSPTPSPSPSPTPIKIPVVSPSPVPSSAPLAPHELDALFQKYGTEYGVSWEKLKVIAKCESGYRANAIGGGGLYGGMYQYVASTWSATRNAMGLDPNPELRFNAEEAIRTTAWKIAHGGIGAWPVCGKK